MFALSSLKVCTIIIILIIKQDFFYLIFFMKGHFLSLWFWNTWRKQTTYGYLLNILNNWNQRLKWRRRTVWKKSHFSLIVKSNKVMNVNRRLLIKRKRSISVILCCQSILIFNLRSYWKLFMGLKYKITDMGKLCLLEFLIFIQPFLKCPC